MKLRAKLMTHKRWIPYTIASCTAVVLYVFLTHLPAVGDFISQIYSYVSPALYGVVVAYLLNPIVNLFANKCFGRMKHRQLARGIGLIITVVLLLTFIAFLFVAAIPHLISSIELLVNNLDTYLARIRESLVQLSDRFGLNIDPDETLAFTELLKKAAEWLPENLTAILDTSVRIGSGLFNVLIIFIIALYVLMDKDRLLRGLKKISVLFIQPKAYYSILTFCRQCHRIIIRYVGSNLLDSLMVGVANFIFMIIFGMPYPSLISVLVGVTNLIPTFGPIIGGAIAGLIILLVDPWTAFWFILWTLFLQTIDGYVIKPLLHGDTLGLPSVWVLVSIIVGGRVLGILGVLLAIPFAAICSYLLDKIIEKKQLRNEARTASEAEGKETPQNE